MDTHLFEHNGARLLRMPRKRQHQKRREGRVDFALPQEPYKGDVPLTSITEPGLKDRK